MRKIYFLSILMAYCSPLYAQLLKSRVITATDGIELPGASVRLIKQGTGTLTDRNGFFEIRATLPSDTLVISSIGFKSLKIPLAVSSSKQILPATLSMEIQNSELQEVIVSTGYTKISSERATGSFTHLNNDLINRSVSTDILSRLEGVSAGLQFYRTNISPHGNTSDLRVRGLSTIHASSAPLIVIDNFPYEGDINTINPNDVEDITILKDAAATSIWGVRAGNGVIVITTKQGKYNKKTAVSFQSNFTSADKPDLFYNPAFLNAQDLIDFQRLRFQNGGFQQNNWTLLPPAVELQIAAQQGKISHVEMERQLKLLATKDIRKDMLKYLYQTSLNQQYALNISGGNNDLKYVSSVGFDKNLSGNVGFNSSRVTLNNQLNYRLGRKLEVFSSLYYVLQAYKNNGLQPSALIPREGGALQSYTALIDEDGLPAAIPYKYRQTYINAATATGLLNWQYRPLEELNLADNSSNNNEIRMNTGLRYSLLSDLALDLKYQFRSATGEVRNYYAPETYYVRDLINRFTQPNGTSVIPLGGILSGSRSSGKSHYGRLQLNYHKSLQQQHQLDALAGVEIREDLSTAGPGYLLYGYDNQTLTSSPYLNYETSYPLRPRSASRIPNTIADVQHFTDRFISYFANAAYTFDQKYTLTLSSRWDASNIFGVATNQKGVPLWSVGGLWNLKQEYLASASSNTIDVLKLRATYGVNGNVNKQVSTMPSITSSIGTVTNLPAAQLLSTGNPSLRWEKVTVWNTALDVACLNGRIRGSFEYYQKAGSDLIGYDYVDPTTGIFAIGLGGITNIDSRINAANMLTQGMDLEISGLISTGKFKWSAVLLASWVKNRITKYSGTESPAIQSFFPVSNAARAPAREGKSADVLYALPWYGLNPATGAMLVYSNNELNENYAAYWSSLQTGSLQEMGVTVPQHFGSVRNTLTLKGLSLSFNVVYKTGYNFRRSSINYTNLINYGNGHKDYQLRWKVPGNELYTTVPALTMRANTTRENIYLNNETLIENGAHLRLKDINLSYKFSAPTLGLSNASIFLYVNNVGILWRANKQGLDPDFPTSDYPPIRTYSLGLKIDL